MVDEQYPVEAGGVAGGDEQYPVESRFVVCHTPPDEHDPVSIVALQHKSVTSVLR